MHSRYEPWHSTASHAIAGMVLGMIIVSMLAIVAYEAWVRMG